MQNKIQQPFFYFLKIGFLAVSGSFIILFFQITIINDKGFLEYFLSIKRMQLFSYYFNLHIFLSIILAPLVETYIMIRLLKLRKYVNLSNMQLCFISAIFWGALHAIKGYSAILPVVWLFFWLSKSTIDWGGEKSVSFLLPWSIHGIYNSLIFVIFDIKY